MQNSKLQFVRVNGRDFPVDCEVVKGANSSVKIKNKRVVMRISRYAFGAKREKMIADFLAWAVEKLENVATDEVFEPEYVDGGRIVMHNKVYDLQIVRERRGRASAKLEGSLIILRIPEDFSDLKIRDTVEKLIIKDQTPYLQEVLNELNELHFQEQFKSCRFKRTKGRFGSCSSQRNINISFRLLFAPREVFRYVCVHELAHLKEFNHSKRFWKLVEDAMPDYKAQERWLKENGMMLG